VKGMKNSSCTMKRIILIAILVLAQSFNAIPLKDLNYSKLNLEMNALNSSFAMVSTAEELYDLPQAKEGNIKCSPIIIRVTDRETLSEDFLRPQIIISGAIHGDERVGPQASLFTSQLLVWSALCEIKKSKIHCDLLKLNNVLKNERIWLAYLASRRDVYIIPAANCIGYMMNRRSDANNVDPNRDFPYSRQDDKCLQSNTAKLFYILMSISLIQIVVTFHGGTYVCRICIYVVTFHGGTYVCRICIYICMFIYIYQYLVLYINNCMYTYVCRKKNTYIYIYIYVYIISYSVH
jgi:hypothetical protein